MGVESALAGYQGKVIAAGITRSFCMGDCGAVTVSRRACPRGGIMSLVQSDVLDGGSAMHNPFAEVAGDSSDKDIELVSAATPI
jgi:hypothetical protein